MMGLLRKVFEKEMYTILTAETGLKALRKFLECRPDVVITGQQISGFMMSENDITGRQLVSLIRAEEGVQPKILFWSSNTSLRDEALRRGADTFLEKTSQLEHLTDAVRDFASEKQKDNNPREAQAKGQH
jgi:DNA-binding response OmpR family regulator